MLQISLQQAKSNFFDRDKIVKAMDKATSKAMSKAAARLRLTAQRSMRYVDQAKPGEQRKTSQPGQPPKAVKQHPLIRRFLYYFYDPNVQPAVVGPIKLPLGQDAQRTMERGGKVRIFNRRRMVRKVGDSGEVKIGLGPSAKLTRDQYGRTVPVTYARLSTEAQAARANRIQEQIYGPEYRDVTLTPRPYMAPALEKDSPNMPALWRNAMRVSNG